MAYCADAGDVKPEIGVSAEAGLGVCSPGFPRSDFLTAQLVEQRLLDSCGLNRVCEVSELVQSRPVSHPLANSALNVCSLFAAGHQQARQG